MNAPTSIRRTLLKTVIVHVSILLLTAALVLAAGAWLMPQREPNPILVYDIMIFRTKNAIVDSSPYLRLLERHSEYAGRKFESSPQLITWRDKADWADPKSLREDSYTFITVANGASFAAYDFQIDMQGKDIGSRVFTEFCYRHKGRALQHCFTGSDKDVQLLLLDQGVYLTYALVRLHRSKGNVQAPTNPLLKPVIQSK